MIIYLTNANHHLVQEVASMLINKFVCEDRMVLKHWTKKIKVSKMKIRTKNGMKMLIPNDL